MILDKTCFLFVDCCCYCYYSEVAAVITNYNIDFKLDNNYFVFINSKSIMHCISCLNNALNIIYTCTCACTCRLHSVITCTCSSSYTIVDNINTYKY